MSLLLQIALSALLVGGIGFGVWNHSQNNKEERMVELQQEQKAQAEVNLSAGTTNADLDRDMATIDAQLKIVEQDSGSIDQGFNDKPITEDN